MLEVALALVDVLAEVPQLFANLLQPLRLGIDRVRLHDPVRVASATPAPPGQTESIVVILLLCLLCCLCCVLLLVVMGVLGMYFTSFYTLWQSLS